MRKVKNVSLLILVSFMLSACPADSNNDPVAGPCSTNFFVTAVTIVDHADALTNAGNDNSFTLTIDAATGTLPLDCLSIAARSATSGDTAYWIMTITHNDNDGDMLVSSGDSFDAVEGPLDNFPASDNGQTMDVEMLKDFPDNPSFIGLGPWAWTAA